MENDFVFSKRLLYATIFGVVVIGGAFYFSQKETPIQTATQQESTESILTEGDYTTILIEESPTTEPTTAGKGVFDTEEAPLTETDILTRNVIGPYLEQLQDETYSQADSERIAESAVAEMLTLDYTPLTKESVTTSSDVSTEATAQYKRDLYTAIKPIFELTEYELTLYARAVRDNSKDEFDALRAIANTYTQAGAEALTVSPPSDVSAVHLDIVNSLYKFATVLMKLSKGFDDPAASLAGTGNFTEAEEDIQHAFSQLQTYFILKDVDTISI